ncbi:hypothetical protein C8R46DRAFT_346944 [Mycena filopes]|nr:hypothetical protein C8R46DRAFT_346944 [Mycena filopes]
MESEFHRQLHTNYVPTDQEIERIRQDLVLQTKEAERLDNLIQELSTQRDKIRTYIASHRALISTPRRLPRDIIDEIFLACLPTTRNATMSFKEAPLLLCRVCSAWRHIALSTPALWASLHIPFHFVLADERRMPALVEWLERSGACPLSLSLVGDGSDHGWGESNIFLESEAVASLHELLASHAKRWRRVKLAEFYPGTLSQFVGTPAPNLEDLDIQGDLPLVLLAPDEIQLAKGPTLRKVTLHSWNLNALRRDMGWDHLTHLVVYCHASGAQVSDPVHPFALLSQTPRLVSFEFTPHLSPGAPISKSLTLPFLRRLVVKDPYSLHVGMLDDLLQNLHMPELRYLVLPVAITAITDRTLVQLSTNSPLITHLHCLIDLFLDSMHIAKGAFLPALTYLELRDTAGKSSAQASTREWSPLPQIVQLFRGLTPTQGCPFPTLAELSVRDCLSQFFAKILREFLERWVDPGMSLRRLSIGFLYDQKESCDDCVAAFRARGVEVSLTFPAPGHPWEPQWKPVDAYIGLPSIMSD